MGWLNRLPGFTQSAPGLEWTIWKRLPAILFWGTAVPLALAAAFWFASPDLSTSAQDRDRLLMVYMLIGLVVLHWTLVLTVAIGCVVVILMKGPAFVADPYPPPGRDPEA
ncbi:MAG: hypothetical protein LH632_17200 [Rhodoferax sp.]|nr:hypothetical protein [Rhodoferax sp.]